MHPRSKINPELVYYIMSGADTLISTTMFIYLVVFYYTIVGLNPLQLVLVGTVLEGSIFIFEIPTGVVADTYSRRLSVVLGFFTLGAAFILTGVARSFLVVLVSQVISGLGYTFLSGAEDAWLADEVGNERLGGVYVRSGQVNRVLSIIGIFASAILASRSLDLPILVGGSMFLLLGLMLVVIMPENNFQPFRSQGEKGRIPAMFATFKEGVRIMRVKPFLISLVLINFFIGASSEGFDRLGDAHLVANFAFPTLVLPLIGSLKPIVWFSIFSLAGGLLSLVVVGILKTPLEKLTPNLGLSAKVLAILTLLFAAGGIGFALAGSFSLAVACLLFRGVVGAVIWPIYSAYQTQSVPSHVRATVLSMTGQGNAIGQVLGGPVVGWVGKSSLRSALVIAGLLILPNSALYRKPDDSDLSRGETPAPVVETVEPEVD